MLCRYILVLAALLLLAPAIIARPPRSGPAIGTVTRRATPACRVTPPGASGCVLGSTRVGGIGVDRDTIDVGRRDGRFARIGLEAAESPVFIVGVTVVFANDEVQQIDLRQKLNPGERTQPLDLQGRARPIKRIEIAARAGHDFRRRAVLTVYAEQVRERELGAARPAAGRLRRRSRRYPRRPPRGPLREDRAGSLRQRYRAYGSQGRLLPRAPTGSQRSRVHPCRLTYAAARPHRRRSVD